MTSGMGMGMGIMDDIRLEQIELDQKTETIHKINEYLRHGGLFNPELMDPEAVRNMLLEVKGRHSKETLCKN